jgi:hypothetical protein
MAAFTSDDLSRMRATQVAYLMDSCLLLAPSKTINDLNEEVTTWPATGIQETSCGLDMRPGQERRRNDMTPLEYDATLRLPITATITNQYHVRITKRFGETPTVPLEYEVVSPIQRGPSGIRVVLRKVVV